MYLHNPLNAHTAVYARFVTARDGAEPPPCDAELAGRALTRYQAHALRLYRTRGLEPPEAAPGEDERGLVSTFRRFLPGLVEGSPLAGAVAAVPVIFPRTVVPDARADAIDGQPVVYVSGGTLDVIELFARTVSRCARLNELALPVLRDLEPDPPAAVPLPWLTVGADQWVGLRVDELLAEAPGGPALRERLCGAMAALAPVSNAGLARHRLSYCLMQLVMRAVRRARQGAPGAVFLPDEPPDGPSPIDPVYLAQLTLGFVVLHEIGHHVLGHNEIGFRGSPHEVALAEAMLGAFELGEGEEAVDLVGRGSSFELAADAFAIQVVAAEAREPVLEAGSLWCAASERSAVVTGDRVRDLVELSRQPDAHPSYSSRVYYLNGRFSTGRRQGAIAQQIAASAESAAGELDHAGSEPITAESDLYREIWAIADHAAREGPYDWIVWPPPEPDENALDESDVLVQGLLAWEAGQLAEAEQLFRSAAQDSRPEPARRARVLLGRVLEERGENGEAEVMYREADAMGDADAANDVGLLLAERGDLAGAEAAYRRADERGCAPAGYNLGLLLDERGDRAGAVEALERADAREHPQAAIILGHWALESGEMDRAEACWYRADERGATGAATNLGYLLQERGYLDDAEEVLLRAGVRGELDGLHNLGWLRQQRGDLDGAAQAYEEAVNGGREASAGNLHAVQLALAERDEGDVPFVQAAAAGDTTAAVELGRRIAKRGRTADAVRVWQHARQLGEPEALNELGLAYAAQGDRAGAEAAFREGADREHRGAIYNLGVILYERGDVDGAERQWRRADALGDGAAAYNLGSLLEDAGEEDEARLAFRRADERGDDLGAVHLGVLLAKSGDTEAAAAAFGRAEQRGSQYGPAQLGDLLYRSGDEPGAEAAWRRADAMGNRDAAYSLGRLLRRLGNLDGAETALRRAVARGHPSASQELARVMAARGHQRAAATA
ncbi:tetratricopeptide repeat protein [Micromonospora sp. CPCC 206061]|uniref:tetratricopeptide repeat protein n=1 Tax=Micromonospora sp. CPCC 206061 TaxID=3122410 RepID=UPI002FF42691